MTYRFGEDNEGRPALYIEAVLPVPQNGETWPVEETIQLRRSLRTQVEGLLEWLDAVYLQLRPAEEEPQDEDEPNLFGT